MDRIEAYCTKVPTIRMKHFIEAPIWSDIAYWEPELRFDFCQEKEAAHKWNDIIWLPNWTYRFQPPILRSQHLLFWEFMVPQSQEYRIWQKCIDFNWCQLLAQNQQFLQFSNLQIQLYFQVWCLCALYWVVKVLWVRWEVLWAIYVFVQLLDFYFFWGRILSLTLGYIPLKDKGCSLFSRHHIRSQGWDV